VVVAYDAVFKKRLCIQGVDSSWWWRHLSLVSGELFWRRVAVVMWGQSLCLDVDMRYWLYQLGTPRLKPVLVMDRGKIRVRHMKSLSSFCQDVPP